MRTPARFAGCRCSANPSAGMPGAAGVQLAPGLRLRREAFGGLAYDPRTGTTVDLDRGALRLLELVALGMPLARAWLVLVAEGLEPAEASDRPLEVVRSLWEIGLIVTVDRPKPPAGAAQHLAEQWPEGPFLMAPEAVHWAITYRCRADCPDCYAERHRRWSPRDLPTPDAVRLVDRIADWGVFQLAVGGGEPLERTDLAHILDHANQRGLSVHLTTSADHRLDSLLPTLSGRLTTLQVGIRHRNWLASGGPEGQRSRLPGIIRRAEERGIPVGANLMLCRTVLDRFETAISRLVAAGFRRVTLLRYKPPSSRERWLEEAPSPREFMNLEHRIAHVMEAHHGLRVRLDCALSFAQRDLAPNVALRQGLRGCVAGARIAAIGPDGSVYPCSQLVHPRFSAGNILRDDAREIWHSSQMRRYRGFREGVGLRRTHCGTCRALDSCGGCRVFALDAWGADPSCPTAQEDPPAYPSWLAGFERSPKTGP